MLFKPAEYWHFVILLQEIISTVLTEQTTEFAIERYIARGMFHRRNFKVSFLLLRASIFLVLILLINHIIYIVIFTYIEVRSPTPI